MIEKALHIFENIENPSPNDKNNWLTAKGVRHKIMGNLIWRFKNTEYLEKNPNLNPNPRAINQHNLAQSLIKHPSTTKDMLLEAISLLKMALPIRQKKTLDIIGKIYFN